MRKRRQPENKYMKKDSRKLLLMLGLILCAALAAGAVYMLIRTFRFEVTNRQLDEQYERELEESRKTIDKLKEQEAELKSDVSQASKAPSPTPQPLLVSIMDYDSGETIPEDSLYMDNPGIYFTARQISDGDEIYLRIKERLSQDGNSVAPDSLRYLKMPYYDQEGKILAGEMVVNAEISQQVLDAFLDAFQNKQRISSMNLEDNCWTEPKDWEELKNRYHLTDEKAEEESEEDDVVFVQE